MEVGQHSYLADTSYFSDDKNAKNLGNWLAFLYIVELIKIMLKGIANEEIKRYENIKSITHATLIGLIVGIGGNAFVSFINMVLSGDWVILVLAADLILSIIGFVIVILLILWLEQNVPEGWYNARAIEDVENYPRFYPMITHDYSSRKEKVRVMWVNRETNKEAVR